LVFQAFAASFPFGSLSDNVAIGRQALQVSNGGSGQSVAIGSQALQSNDPGQNVAIGYQSCTLTPATQGNVAIGYQSQVNSFDVAIGAGTLNANAGSQNVCIGYQAGNSLGSGNNNVLVGYSVLTSASGDSSNNSILGSNALSSSIIVINDCVAVGYNALLNNNASQITASVPERYILMIQVLLIPQLVIMHLMEMSWEMIILHSAIMRFIKAQVAITRLLVRILALAR